MVSLLLWYDCNIEARDRDESTALIKVTNKQTENELVQPPDTEAWEAWTPSGGRQMRSLYRRQRQEHCDSTQALDVRVMKTHSQNLKKIKLE